MAAITEAYMNFSLQADQAKRCVRALAMIEMPSKDEPAQVMQSMYLIVHYQRITGFEPFSVIVKRELVAERGQTYLLIFCVKISSVIFRSQHSMTSLRFTLLTSSPEKPYFPASKSRFNPPIPLPPH